MGRSPQEVGEPEWTWAERALQRVPASLHLVQGHCRDDDPLVAIGMVLVELDHQEPQWKALIPEEAGSDDREGFARAWCALVLDNDALPVHQQLTRAELEHARALLAAFFFSGSQLSPRAASVLRMIEERFARGAFAQARLLLELFDTDESTRRSNERNLFFECMSTAMLQRRTSLRSGLQAELRGSIGPLVASGPDGGGRLLQWLEQEASIRLQLLRAEPLEAWPGDASATLTPDFVASLGAVVPHRRWRRAAKGERGLTDELVEHLAHRGVHRHLHQVLMAAYFVTLATGRTGYESLIVDLVQWLSRHHDAYGTRVLPDLHRRWSVQDEPMEDALNEVVQTHLGGSAWGGGAFSREAIGDALRTVLGRLAEVDLAEIPEGDYDLGGMVLDVLTDFPSRGIERSLRIHRLP